MQYKFLREQEIFKLSIWIMLWSLIPMMMNIWGWKLKKFEGMKERRIFFLFFIKKKTFWKNQQKNNRKSRQNLCVINCIVWWLARIVPHSWFYFKKMIWLIAWSWVLRGCCHVIYLPSQWDWNLIFIVPINYVPGFVNFFFYQHVKTQCWDFLILSHDCYNDA